MAEIRHITPEGYRRLAEELEHLFRKERPKVVQEVADAAALGDRSENAEYIYGKKRLREIDRRMNFLSALLDKLRVVDPKDVKSERVQFGATVRVVDEEGSERRYQLVGVDEVDASNGRISIASPVGKALLGKRVGDVVVIKRPAGELEVELVELRYE